MAALQEGIYFDHGQRPPPCFSVMFLRASADANAARVARVLRDLWQMYADLKQGRIRDLPGTTVGEPGSAGGSVGNLAVLIGYGIKAFKVPDVSRSVPEDLRVAQFRSPTTAGGPLLLGAGLRYLPGLARNSATEEIVIQATADTPLAANRAIVETWKFLQDDAASGSLTLELSTAFTGFNREDGRSWIDFHDGVSNLTSGQERFDAIAIKPLTGPDAWTVDGTYLAFIRNHVDLSLWRTLTTAQQEAAVGRTKTSGCPLIDIVQGQGVADQQCPMSGTSSILDPTNAQFREPRHGVASTKDTHVQRTNHGGPSHLPGLRRIFRQGYEFLEPPRLGAPMTLGLNFVSFQDTPERLFGILGRVGWMGDANFGGRADLLPPGGLALLAVEAAGVFICPPVLNGEAFPGEGIWTG
jgi:deferrochelatase/peroxidase EfeB